MLTIATIFLHLGRDRLITVFFQILFGILLGQKIITILKSKKQLIKEKAARLFRQKGYQATTMRDLATSVGVKAASLYNHVSSKQMILAELLMEVARAFTKGMEDIENSSLTSVEKLEKLVSLHIRMTVERTDAVSIITGEWIHLEEPVFTEYTTLRDSYEQKFKNIISNCIDDGYFEEVNIDIALYSILSSLRWLYSWYGKHRNISPIELEKQMIHCLIIGLRKN